MKDTAVNIARLLLGLIFFVFGLNGFFVFIEPPAHTETSGAFINLLIATKFIYFEKTIEVVCGTLLLLNRFVPLALACLAPLVVNILLFHLLMERHTLPAGIIPFILQAFLMWKYRRFYRAILTRNAALD